MATWILVWLVIGIVTTMAIIACLVALIRHVLLLGRTARAMQEAVEPIARDITDGAARAGARASTLRPPSS